jgi:hypothetical protein
MDKIKQQANIVRQLLFAGDTAQIYQQTLTRTWDILRETSQLVWLVICLTFVGGEWFYRRSVQLGRDTRTWYNDLSRQTPSPGEGQSMETTGQALLDTVQSGASYLLSQARKQLGLQEPPAPPASPAAPPAPKPLVDPIAPSTSANIPTISTESDPKDLP